ncbi:MAG: DNA polymerase I [Atribacterota bacterium]|nr:DNA polymerase I [Atribacterota bacterium]
MDSKKKELYLIDGQGLIYRAYFALPKLTTTFGQPINAAYGFTLLIIKILEEYHPDGIVIAFDSPKPTFRHKIYGQYKAQREKMPQELIDQLPIIKKIVDAFQIPSVAVEEYEADDIIGSIVQNEKISDFKKIIVTGDRDLLQLINENTEIVLMQKGITQVKQHNLETVKNMLGFPPGLIPDYIGLKGDSSDNIPGIAGIGEKTAKKLIADFGNLEKIFANLDKIKSKAVKNKIENSQEEAFLSRSLAVIKKDMKLNLEINNLIYKEPDYYKLKDIFEKYEFKKLLEKIPGEKLQKNSFSTHDTTNYKNINNEQDLKILTDKIKNREYFAFLFDISYCNNEKILKKIAITLENDSIYLIYVSSGDILLKEKNAISKEKIIELLYPLFQSKKIKKIGFDLKDTLFYFLDIQSDFFEPFSDLKIAFYLLNPTQENINLKEIIKKYFNNTNDENYLHITEDCKNDQEEEIAFCWQTGKLIPLEKMMLQEMQKNELIALYKEVEIPLINIICNMEKKGIKIDSIFLKEMSQKFAVEIDNIKKEIFEISGETFNLNSPKQLSVILFEKLGLPVIKKIKTGYSTNANVLTKLSEEHIIVAKILHFRELEKLKNTYIDKLPKLINSKTGRIHASFNQTGTSTGRLSSNNPNLQNIPIRTELGKEIRNAFIADNGCIYLSADYSQIELRILAHLSNDMSLIEAFSKDQDVHTYTAANVFNVDLDAVSDEMRRIAKVINFGIIYGMSSYGLSNNLGISNIEAQNYIDAYFQKYFNVKEYINKQIKNARKDKIVRTMLNRIRYLEGIDSPNKNIREFFERAAVNTPIQGTAADLIKIAMVKIEQQMVKNNLKSNLILQIHDELIFEIPAIELQKRKKIIKKIMENSLKLNVPLKVNFKTGYRWGELD